LLTLQRAFFACGSMERRLLFRLILRLRRKIKRNETVFRPAGGEKRQSRSHREMLFFACGSVEESGN
jgi:hypothetical protein